MDLETSTINRWQIFWNKLEKGRNLVRRRIGFERAQFILQHLTTDQLGGARIFDLGSGYAEVSRHLLAEIPESMLLGFDWSADALKVAKQGTVAFAERADLAHENCCNDFGFFGKHEDRNDLALSLCVVEHFPDPARIIKRIAQVLDSGGVLVPMTPNRRSRAALSRKIKEILGTCTFGYQRKYSPEDLESWCIDAGLQILSKHSLLRQENPIDDRILRFFSVIDRWFSRVISRWGVCSYVFAAEGRRHV